MRHCDDFGSSSPDIRKTKSKSCATSIVLLLIAARVVSHVLIYVQCLVESARARVSETR